MALVPSWSTGENDSAGNTHRRLGSYPQKDMEFRGEFNYRERSAEVVVMAKAVGRRRVSQPERVAIVRQAKKTVERSKARTSRVAEDLPRLRKQAAKATKEIQEGLQILETTGGRGR